MAKQLAPIIVLAFSLTAFSQTEENNETNTSSDTEDGKVELLNYLIKPADPEIFQQYNLGISFLKFTNSDLTETEDTSVNLEVVHYFTGKYATDHGQAWLTFRYGNDVGENDVREKEDSSEVKLLSKSDAITISAGYFQPFKRIFNKDKETFKPVVLDFHDDKYATQLGLIGTAESKYFFEDDVRNTEFSIAAGVRFSLHPIKKLDDKKVENKLSPPRGYIDALYRVYVGNTIKDDVPQIRAQYELLRGTNSASAFIKADIDNEGELLYGFNIDIKEANIIKIFDNVKDLLPSTAP